MLDIKERCYNYSLKTIAFLQTLPDKRIYWPISDQLLRAATSIGANITEAKSASSRKDFTRSYEIALKSANETSYWLKLLKDITGGDGMNVEQLIRENEEITRIIAACIISLKRKS